MQNNTNVSKEIMQFRMEINQYIAKVNSILLLAQASICIMGLIGNLLVLIVINQKLLRNTSSAVFISYLAAFDSAVLILHGAHLIKIRNNHLLHCLLTYLTELTTCCATWILVIITIERCIAIYSPLYAKRFCRVSSARISMYLLLVISTVLTTAVFPVFYHVPERPKSPKCYVRPKARLILRIYEPTLFYFIPDILLLSNLFTVYSLCKRRQRLSTIYTKHEPEMKIRVNDIHSNRKQTQLTIMLVSVSLSFYLFSTPAMIAFIMESNSPQHRNINKTKIQFLYSQLSVIMLQLNHATNFIFYCFVGQRFRRVAWHTLQDFLRKMKYFYHRYILCNRTYELSPMYQMHTNRMANITATNRSSIAPYSAQQHHGRLTV